MLRVQSLLHCIGLAVQNAMAHGPSSDMSWSQHLNEIAEGTWESGRLELAGDEFPLAFGELVTADPGDYAEMLERVLQRMTERNPGLDRQCLGDYLGLLPQMAQQVFRRPSDPTGRTVPTGLTITQAEDLLPFLPPRRPRFRPAGGPGGLDNWELVELIGLSECAEVWIGSDDQQPEQSPAALKFATDPHAAEAVLAHRDLFLKVFELNEIPGIVPLRSVYLETDPPCLESPYVYGYDLTGLINEWRWRYTTAKPDAAAKLIRRIAEIVGQAHAKGIVHRDLKPSNILLHPGEGGKFSIWLTDYGWGQIAARRSSELVRGGTPRPAQMQLACRGAYTPIYEAPQISRQTEPDPRDDVYSLGVIWYQLLCRNPRAESPIGTDWAEELAAEGMSDPQIQLLDACLATRPDKRPENASVLADTLASIIPPPTSGPATGKHDGSRVISLKSSSSTQLKKISAPPPVPAADPPVYTGPASGRQDALSGGFLTGVGTVKIPAALKVPTKEGESASHGPESGKLPRSVRNSIGMSFALIPAGRFIMGSPEDEPGRREHEGPAHEVTISAPFYLAAYPVTQSQYEKVMGQNPSHFQENRGGGPEFPVECVTWFDAERFCTKLGLLPEEELAGRSYRLPTEAEWEYACRAGTTTAYPVGDKLPTTAAQFAASGKISSKLSGKGRTSMVGTYPPNAWWLYDMIGNVSEWVADWYDEYYYFDSPPTDPPGPSSGLLKVTRGGAWISPAEDCRSAARRPHDPESPANTIGFRVVMIQNAPSESALAARPKAKGPRWLG